MNALFASLLKTWQALGASQRATLVVAMTAAAAVVGVIGWFGSRTEWVTISRRGGDPMQVAAMADALASAQIPFQVAGAGDLLQVPAEMRSRALLEISKKPGASSTQEGFELLDKTTAFTTSLLERVNYQRAVMGEIQKVLETWPNIASARVMIANEKESWSRDEKAGTAAVSLALARGARLTPSEVGAIQTFVAMSWHSLAPARVAVVADGQKLTREPGGENEVAFNAGSAQLLQQMELEDRLRRKAQEAIDLAEGAGRAVVTVNAELDFESRQLTSHKVNPDEFITRETSETKTEKKSGDLAMAGSGGVAGAGSNIPKDAKPASDSAGGAPPSPAPRPEGMSDTQKTTTAKVDYSTTDTITRKNGYDVKRLSVALLADKTLAPRLADLEKVVKSAVGYDEERRDTFSSSATSEFPKATTATDLAAPATPTGFDLPSMISTGARAAALLGCVGLFLFLLKRAGASRGAAAPAARGARTGARVPAAGGGFVEEEADLAIGGEAPAEAIARNTVPRQAAAAALADPPAAGRVVRSWLEAKATR